MKIDYFIDDNTWNPLYADIISHLLPGSKNVIVWRDPIHNISSY